VNNISHVQQVLDNKGYGLEEIDTVYDNPGLGTITKLI
jgi:hypothetical protein